MLEYKLTPFNLIGLTRSEKTSVMSTVKRPGTHIWQINWQIYPLPSRSASGSEWQFQIFTVKAHNGRSTGRSMPPSTSI